ncbi:photosystem II 44 kDa protein [Iris pallida]|uniref:Photosystem II 44 kDa protein (Chloroplast) n=1 Tax=Iris pallida TaxID=29817 RepID=A0AAX6HGV7_IRIPA|nr:photosystem II 44 kDa protein [Iris pallida]KAJ6840269.1 photosystem II 44 kDa protein [Iris pallida]KAJ6852815.1 photosystem II 44 kDa protein [Iris pallida]
MVFKLPRCSLDCLPFLTGLTRGRFDLLQSMLHSHSFVLTKLIYLSAIPFSANHPFPTSPPDRSSVDRRMNRG